MSLFNRNLTWSLCRKNDLSYGLFDVQRSYEQFIDRDNYRAVAQARLPDCHPCLHGTYLARGVSSASPKLKTHLSRKPDKLLNRETRSTPISRVGSCEWRALKVLASV
jgi:hypothetical protein